MPRERRLILTLLLILASALEVTKGTFSLPPPLSRSLPGSKLRTLISLGRWMSDEWDLGEVDLLLGGEGDVGGDDGVAEAVHQEMRGGGGGGGGSGTPVGLRVRRQKDNLSAECRSREDEVECFVIVADPSWRLPPASQVRVLSGAYLVPAEVEIEPYNLRFDSRIFAYWFNDSVDGGDGDDNSVLVSEVYVNKYGSESVRVDGVGSWSASAETFTYSGEEYIWDRRTGTSTSTRSSITINHRLYSTI